MALFCCSGGFCFVFNVNLSWKMDWSCWRSLALITWKSPHPRLKRLSLLVSGKISSPTVSPQHFNVMFNRSIRLVYYRCPINPWRNGSRVGLHVWPVCLRSRLDRFPSAVVQMYWILPDLSNFVAVSRLQLKIVDPSIYSDYVPINVMHFRVSGKLVLDRVLCQAEKLFLSYCRHSVLDSFVILP